MLGETQACSVFLGLLKLDALLLAVVEAQGMHVFCTVLLNRKTRCDGAIHAAAHYDDSPVPRRARQE
ncbi:hypothetical protein D3C76_1348780 [compost metagenome]